MDDGDVGGLPGPGAWHDARPACRDGADRRGTDRAVLHRDDPGVDVWRDTSTLYLRILRGHLSPAEDARAETVAAGVITIHVPGFLRQLTTFRATGPEAARGLARFGRLFLGELWDVYGPDLVA